MSIGLCKRYCKHQVLVLSWKWMVTFYELFFPIYYHPWRLLRIFIFIKEIHIQDLPMKEVVQCCIIWEFQNVVPLPVGVWWIRYAGMGDWMWFFPQKAVIELIMLPGSGHLAFLSLHIHNDQFLRFALDPVGLGDGTWNQGMSRHMFSGRFFEGSWRELDEERQRRENSERTLLTS